VKRYSHVFSIAFTVESDHAGTDDDPVPIEDLLRGLSDRTFSLEQDHRLGGEGTIEAFLDMNDTVDEEEL